MTPVGCILSRWQIADGTFRPDVEIPPQGVTATAVLPSGATQTLGLGRQEIAELWTRTQFLNIEELREPTSCAIIIHGEHLFAA
jgi:hypothetical protein